MTRMPSRSPCSREAEADKSRSSTKPLAFSAWTLLGVCDLRQVLILGVSILAAAANVACSAGEPGTAIAGSAQTSTGSSSMVQELPISENLSISDLLAEPCSLLSESMLNVYGYDSVGVELGEVSDLGRDLENLSGPTCGWSAEENADSQVLSVTLIDRESEHASRAFETAREHHQNEILELWEETTVSGYPAAYWGIRDNRDRGDCSVLVAISDKALFSVAASYYFDDPQRACVDAEKIAEDILRKLEEGA